jgi:hypothetical protein
LVHVRQVTPRVWICGIELMKAIRIWTVEEALVRPVLL